jgi:hypothetical protein
MPRRAPLARRRLVTERMPMEVRQGGSRGPRSIKRGEDDSSGYAEMILLNPRRLGGQPVAADDEGEPFVEPSAQAAVGVAAGHGVAANGFTEQGPQPADLWQCRWGARGHALVATTAPI